MELVDTHTHLGDPQFEPDRKEVLARAFSAGISHIVEIAANPEDWDKALSFSRAHLGRVVCTWGFHPHFSQDWSDTLIPLLKEKLISPLVVAVGEIGLDYVKSSAPPHIQRRTLEKMLEIASQVRKPVILHCRKAYDDLFSVLEKSWNPSLPESRFQGVMHCFSGTVKQAMHAVELGLAIGVDGPVTYPKNDALREAIRHVGLKNIVLETDSPYLSPQISRGSRNEPAMILEICRRVAEIFGVSLEEAAEKTTKNAQDLFGFCLARVH